MAQLVILRPFAFSRNRMLVSLVLQQQQMPLSCGCVLQQLRKEKALQSSEPSSVSTDVRPLGEKIKENTKTVSYTAIILAGIGVTSIMFWAIFRELFSSFSPNNVYSKTLEFVKEDTRVCDAIGTPIKGYGEQSRRGRRQLVAHSLYDRNGVPHMRMKFYVEGLRNKATVHLEARKSSSGVEYRYLFVQLDHYPRTTIIIQDNRGLDTPQNYSHPQLEFTSFSKK